MLWSVALATLMALPSPDAPLLVSTNWLAEHLHDPKLVVFQIGDDRSKPVYDQGHIPGAQFLNPWKEISAPRTPGALALELPSAAQLDSVLRAKGISNDSRVVLYEASEYFSPVARTFLTFEYAGMGGRVSILDGGLELWKQEQRPVSADLPSPARGAFSAQLHPDVVVDAAWVKAHLDDHAVSIVDARDPEFYNGADTHQGRNGHIPNAVSLPFGTVIDKGGKFLAVDALKQLFDAAGVHRDGKIITYCHIGQQASLVWFAAKLVGAKAALYDGSFQDWAARTEFPVVASRP